MIVISGVILFYNHFINLSGKTADWMAKAEASGLLSELEIAKLEVDNYTYINLQWRTNCS